jgi:hypothetical protein
MKFFKKLNTNFNWIVNEKISSLKIIWESVYSFYWINLGWRFRGFWLGIKNLWRWFPVIWEDRDWDDYFIWEILKTKLKYQSDYIGSSGNHISAKYDAQRMMLCVRLIEKIQVDFYACEYMDYNQLEYNFSPVEDQTGYLKLDIQVMSENYYEYLAKHRASVRKVLADKKQHKFKLDGDDDKEKLAMNVAYYNEKKAKDLLFKILNRDIKNWWD